MAVDDRGRLQLADAATKHDLARLELRFDALEGRMDRFDARMDASSIPTPLVRQVQGALDTPAPVTVT